MLKAVLPAESGAEYRIAPFAGGRYVSWPDEAELVPTLVGTRSHRAPIIADVRQCLGATADRTALPPGSKNGTDILAAMATAGSRLNIANTKVRRLYIATDGRATDGCAKPSSEPDLTEDVVKGVLAACQNSGELPQDLVGVSITFVGLGTSSSSVAAVKPREQRLLAELWTSLCQRMQAAKCDAPAVGLTQRVTPTVSAATA